MIMINLHERMLPTSVGVEPTTSSRKAHPLEPPRPGHFVSSPREKEMRDSSGDEREG